jgi:hypothetical protein
MTKSEYIQLISDKIDQQLFPAVVQTQDLGLSCSYCTPEGLKCFLGILLPDDHPFKYSTKSLNWHIDQGHQDEFLQYFPEGVNLRQMYECQKVHDGRGNYTQQQFTEAKSAILSELKTILESEAL